MDGAAAAGGGTALYLDGVLNYYLHADWEGTARLATTPARGLWDAMAYGPDGVPYDEAGGNTDCLYTDGRGPRAAYTTGMAVGAVPRVHQYVVGLRWSGNTGAGTASYAAYRRDYELTTGSGKTAIAGSSDAVFRGDAARWNPEELFVAALAACHQLAYLHLCADAGITVVAYGDRAEGEMEETADGGGRFIGVVLHPDVTVAAGADLEKARQLHEEARLQCFIANSVSCAVTHEPNVHY